MTDGNSARTLGPGTPAHAVANAAGPRGSPPPAGTSGPHATAALHRRQADARALEQSAVLIARTRQLDTRLNVAAQSDRQLARRAASLVTQLARRLSVLLSRTSSVLPMLPTHGYGRRINHYVVHAERAAPSTPTTGGPGGRVRMLTIGSNGMLRVGTTDDDVPGMVWSEYDPSTPAAGWDLETVIERLSVVVTRVEGHVAAVESRVQERARMVTSLETTSRRPSPVEASSAELNAEFRREPDAAMSGTPLPVPATGGADVNGEAAPAAGSLEDARLRYARSKHKRHLFDRLR